MYSYYYLGRIANQTTFSIEDQTFSDDINMRLDGFFIGIKPGIGMNYQLSQSVKIRLFAGYSYYFVTSYQLNISDISGGGTKTYPLSDSHVSMQLNGNSISTFPDIFNGLCGILSLIIRF